MSIEQKKRAILAAVGFLFLIGVAIMLSTNSFVLYRNDFFARWYATTKLFELDRNLYDSLNGLDVVAYTDFRDASQADFYYPAHLLVFIGPLALLPYSVALPIWLLAAQLFYLVGLWLVVDKTNWPTTIGQKTWFMIAAILFLPYIQQTLWGQFNTIAVLSLALTYLALNEDRFFLAGGLATGMTFKPQGTGLVLVFLLFWVVLRKRRWPFLLGFALTGIVLWAIAEILQPVWVADFLASLGQYIPTRSVIDRYWNPNQLVSAFLILGSLAIFTRNRASEADSHVFAAELVLSFSVWAMVVPIVGMMHMVLFPVMIVLLMKGLKTVRPNQYQPALYGFGLIYLLGWIGFVIGLLVPGWYGYHITWSEFAYKEIVPILLILFSMPFCLTGLNTRRRS